MGKDDCIFCKLAAGEVPAQVVRQDEQFMAFRDIAPKAETHVLVIPREHHADLDAWAAAPGDSDALIAFVAATARELAISGRYRLITNVGPDAGQEVFHLHWHVLAGGALPGF